MAKSLWLRMVQGQPFRNQFHMGSGRSSSQRLALALQLLLRSPKSTASPWPLRKDMASTRRLRRGKENPLR